MVPRVSRSRQHFPDGFDLHLQQAEQDRARPQVSDHFSCLLDLDQMIQILEVLNYDVGMSCGCNHRSTTPSSLGWTDRREIERNCSRLQVQLEVSLQTHAARSGPILGQS